MKTLSLPLTLLAFTAAPLIAQTASTATHPPVHHTAPAATHAASACAVVPPFSSKIPVLAATTACPKSLFTITIHPTASLDYVSPLVDPEVRKALGLDPRTFTLAYQDIKVGTGEPALPNKQYTVDYTGYLLDGTQFDSSVGKPDHFSFPIGQHKVIPGWDLGLQGMRMGGKRRLFIPYELAYGEGPHGNIPAKSELIFDIELISQKDVPPAPTPTGPQPQPRPVPGAPAPGAAAPAPKPATAPATAPATPPAGMPPATTPPATTPKQ